MAAHRENRFRRTHMTLERRTFAALEQELLPLEGGTSLRWKHRSQLKRTGGRYRSPDGSSRQGTLRFSACDDSPSALPWLLCEGGPSPTKQGGPEGGDTQINNTDAQLPLGSVVMTPGARDLMKALRLDPAHWVARHCNSRLARLGWAGQA